jgi:hypothetical protein
MTPGFRSLAAPNPQAESSIAMAHIAPIGGFLRFVACKCRLILGPWGPIIGFASTVSRVSELGSDAQIVGRKAVIT